MRAIKTPVETLEQMRRSCLTREELGKTLTEAILDYKPEEVER